MARAAQYVHHWQSLMKKVIETPANKNSMIKDEHHKTLFSVTHTKTLFNVTDTSVSLYGVETFLSVFQRCFLVTGFTNANQALTDKIWLGCAFP